MIQFFILMIIIGLIIFYTVYNRKDILAPNNLFTLIILTTYALACLRFSDLQHEYNFIFFVQLILAVLAFRLGYKIKIINTDEKWVYTYNTLKLKKVIYFLFFIVVGSFAVMWVKLGPPPAISKVDRFTYFVSGFGTLYLMIDILTFLLIYDLFDRKAMKKMSYVMLFILLIIIILMANKFQIIYLICQYTVLYNLMKKKINMKILIGLVLIILIIFVFYYSIIYKGMYISNDDMYIVNRMNFSPQFSILTNPYLYIAFNYENLYYYMSCNDVQFGFGYYVLQDVLDAFDLKELFFENSDFLENQWRNNLQYKWLTTGTIFREFYMDFGLIGIYLGCMIIGYISKISYFKGKNSKSIFYVYFYTSNMVSIFLAFFTNNFISINYLLNIFCSYWISRYCFSITKKSDIYSSKTMKN